MADVDRARLSEVVDGPLALATPGPYLAERAWGTVREDYGATGEAWDFFPHLVPFHEYFHSDTGAWLGALHQIGWTGSWRT